MKKKLLYLGFLVLSTGTVFSQNIEWAKSFRGISNEGTLNFSSGGMAATGGGDNYLLVLAQTLWLDKYSSTGSKLWARNLGAITNGSISSDKAGNVYFISSFTGTIQIGNIKLTSAGGRDVLALKYSSSGVLLWAKSYGGPERDTGMDISADAAGNIYITGAYAGSAKFGSFTKSTATYQSAFIARLNSTGDVQWVKGETYSRFPDENKDSQSLTHHLKTDNLGNVYAFGYSEADTIKFDSHTYLGEGSNRFHAFLVKLSSTGASQWITGFFIDERQHAIKDMTTDAAGNVFITGVINFGSPGHEQMVLSKFSKNGTWVFDVYSNYDGTQYHEESEGNGVVTDASGNVYVLGHFIDQARFGNKTIYGNSLSGFLVKYNNIGEFQWASKVAGSSIKDTSPEFVACNNLTIDENNNLYMAGHFQSDLNINQFYLESAGENDVFLAKIKNTLLTKPAITHFTLINADNNKDIYTIEDNDTYYLNELPSKNLNIRANTTGATGSVIFSLNNYIYTTKNSKYTTENSKPYSIGGDNNGDYKNWGYDLSTAYRLMASPYPLANGGGSEGEGLTVDFKFYSKYGANRQKAPVSPELISVTEIEGFSAYPNPFSSELTIEYVSKEDGPLQIELFNFQGISVEENFKGNVSKGEKISWKINGLELRPGVYLSRIKTTSGVK
ncbi:MAG: hypothetical protein JWM28_1172, partial [Chitinophagaceae bacterium]|nr:hypothetical protein [Chitinophagaceae bacterium]